MRKTTLLLLSCCSLLLLTQCQKADQEVAPKMQSDAEIAATAAAAPCSCSESSTKVSGTSAQAWATQFAPLIKFDRASPDYPTTVENIFTSSDPATIVCGGKLALIERTVPRSKDFPTYYDVQVHPSDADRIFIDYWWAYKRQENCFSNLGGHDYDLEHVVIQFRQSTQRIISVTYFQHGGYYTKDYRSKAAGTRVQAWVGKFAHGMYHFGSSITLPGYECAYWGDYRNPNGTQDEVLTGNRLVQMSCGATEFNFSGNWGDPGKGPLFRDRAYWNFPACYGSDGPFGQDGCSACDFGNTKLIGTI